MIRTFRALAWLRWRLLVNNMRAKTARDVGERLSRVFHVILPFLIVLFILPGAVGLGFLALWGGRSLAAATSIHPAIWFAIRISLGAATAVVVLLPLARARGGGAGRLTRMLLLPIPGRALHLAELLAGIADPWLLVLLPAIFLFPVGFLSAGATAAGGTLLVAGVVLVAALLALASCVSQAVQILLRDRKRAEMLVLASAILLSSFGLLVVFITNSADDEVGPRREARQAADATPPSGGPGSTGDVEEEGVAGPPPGSGRPERERRRGVELRFPYVWVLPSELYTRTVELAAAGRTAAGLPLAGLVLQGAVAFGLSASLQRRLLEQPESISRGRRGARREVRMPRVPGLSPAASAVATAQFRTFLRTVKGKMAVFFGPFVGVGFGLLMYHELDIPEIPGGMAPPFTLLAGLFCILGLQPILMNLFVTDGAGLTLQFLGPISDRDLVRGKLAATGLMIGVPALFCGLVGWIVDPGGSPLLWVAALLTAASSYLALSPMAAVLSAVFPKHANLNSMGKDGNPHALAGFLGVLLVAPTAGPPILLALFGIFILESHLAALLLVTAWTGLSAALGHFLAIFAAGIVAKRRENLALVAQGR